MKETTCELIAKRQLQNFQAYKVKGAKNKQTNKQTKKPGVLRQYEQQRQTKITDIGLRKDSYFSNDNT